MSSESKPALVEVERRFEEWSDEPALVEVERRFEEWSDFKVTRNEWGTMPSTPQRLVMVGPALALAIRKETSI